MNTNSLSLAKIRHLLNLVSQQRGTGELLFYSNSASPNSNLCERQWKLHFFHGRLLYATSNLHRVRRWHRAIKQNSCKFILEEYMLDEPWEYELLNQGIAQNQLSLNEAKGVIKTSILEVFFDLLSYPSVVASRWQQNKPLTAQIALLEAERIFEKTQFFWERWQAQKLQDISPNLAPILKLACHKENLEIRNLAPLLNGQNTIWDIAYQMRRSIATVTQLLLPLVRQGSVELAEVPDNVLPIRQKTLIYAQIQQPKVSSYQPLIACIDDSPLIGKTLEKILAPSGYRLLNITDPLEQMPILVKQKPDLILLDLMMPSTTGYNLCSFLRNTPIFEKTPIIIFTSSDNIVNRSHAKLTGASDFLSKPPDAQKLLQKIHKHLPQKNQEKPMSKQVPNLVLVH